MNASTKILLLDVEGTTTSIEFVKDVLFPFFEANVADFLQRKWGEENIQLIVEELKPLFNNEIMNGCATLRPVPKQPEEKVIKAVAENVRFWSKTNRKITPLKTLQGLVWFEGYSSGKIKGHCFPDVPEAFEKAKKMGLKICIYSSGSVAAQKLLFAHSIFGDLDKQIEGNFDTTIGLKFESDSYQNIAKKLNVGTGEILFVTDVEKEAYAAQKVGMSVVLSVREGNAPLSKEAQSEFPIASSLTEIFL